jgi:hypothetical protein
MRASQIRAQGAASLVVRDASRRRPKVTLDRPRIYFRFAGAVVTEGGFLSLFARSFLTLDTQLLPEIPISIAMIAFGIVMMLCRHIDRAGVAEQPAPPRTVVAAGSVAGAA